MGSAGKVEQGCLTAIRIAHQCHIDGLVALLGLGMQVPDRHGLLVVSGRVYIDGALRTPGIRIASRVVAVRVLTGCSGLRCLGSLRIRHHLNHLCLVVTQRNLITHDFVFHGVL